ncbi:uncharacterized protein VNE69_01363 [Vairimorpha necatrix]|uniref:Uncharacterized protein n=1 Tax=Vairimorpha necatrix TaxID=6039 RepID=A0AAX4J923_9MICR
MKIKSSQNVFFLDTISLTDELKIIENPIENKPKITKNKSFGKCLQLSDKKLIKNNIRNYKDYFYNSENQNSVFLVLMLLSAHPFRNFLENFKENISDTRDFPLFDKFINLFVNKQILDINQFIPFEDCSDFLGGYSFILRSLHQELVSSMHFEEDSWNLQKKGKSIKSIYSEYSPIVEIFQGKMQNDNLGNKSGNYSQNDNSGNKSGNFEIIKDLEFIYSSNCKKKPFVILTEGYSPLQKNDDYILSSVITFDDSLIIFSEEKAFEYRTEGFQVLDQPMNILNNAHNIRLGLYSRIK